MNYKKLISSKDLSYITEIFRFASNEASKKIIEIYKTDFSTSFKDDKTPLTVADIESNNIILKILKKEFKNIPIVSEESIVPDLNNLSDFILVDPLDGTKEFINKNGEFTVNISLIQKNHPICGVINCPVNNIQYFSDGLSSYKFSDEIKKKITVKTNEKITFILSRSHLDRETEEFIKLEKNKHIVRKGSSLKFCLIAEGKADIYPRYGHTMEWDTAAGHAILKTAGGVVLDYNLKSLEYGKKNYTNSSFIAFNQPIEQLLKHFKRI